MDTKRTLKENRPVAWLVLAAAVLVGVLGIGTPCGSQHGIDTHNAHLTHIDRSPHKQIVRHCHYFVGHMVQIAVQSCPELHMGQRLVNGNSHIQLIGLLGFEVFAAISEEIILIEGRHSEDVFIRCPHIQRLMRKWCP